MMASHWRMQLRPDEPQASSEAHVMAYGSSHREPEGT
jgi:hypothetical protein